MNASTRQADGERGFTLLELMVVMGILMGFLVMLVQFVDTGVSLFGEGESGQALADRATVARLAVERELRALRGPDLDLAAGVPPTDRLLAQLLPLGLPSRSQPGDPLGMLLRAAIRLEPADEERLLEDDLLLQAARELGEQPDPRAVAARAAALRKPAVLRGGGRLLLLPWPKTGDGALLELRAAHFLPGARLQLDRDRFVDPFAVPVPGGSDLPALAVYAATAPLVDDLLHFELRFWSQATRSFDAGDASGPEPVWDSARAGWLSDPGLGPVFRFDRDAASLTEPADDVFPHAVQVTLVVARGPREALEGLLADDLEPGAKTLQLVDGARFPGAEDGGFVKVEGEWIRYTARAGDTLRGLVRGQRGTPAKPHAAGAAVRVGRTVVFTVALPHGKDDWNG